MNLRSDSEARFKRKVILDSVLGEDGTLRAELRVADISRQRAHIYAEWDSAEYTVSKCAPEDAPTEEEKKHAKDVLDKVIMTFTDAAAVPGAAEGKKAQEVVGSRFTATGGEYVGTSPPTEEQKERAKEIETYLRHINGPADGQGTYYRTFARLVYSGIDHSWDVRICPAAIKGGCDPSVEHGCVSGKDEGTMFANSWGWYQFVSDSLKKPGIGKVYIALGRLHEI